MAQPSTRPRHAVGVTDRTATSDASRPVGSFLRRSWPGLLCVVVYLALAAVVYGFRSPVTSQTLPPCACGDISSQVWFMGWVEHALATGHNLFASSYVAYPGGINLMNNTAAPLLGFLLAPVTALLGPISSYNLAMELGFGLSAVSMCFVLRRWTRWWPAAFLGGLLYAFSPYMVGQGESHDFLTFVPLPPIMLALLDDLIVRRRHPVRNGFLLGLVVTAQLLISPEVLEMAGLLALFGVVILVLRHPVAALERVRAVATGLVVAVATLVVLGGYPLYIYFDGPYHVSGPPHPVSSLAAYYGSPLSVFYPTQIDRFTLGGRGVARGVALTYGGNLEFSTYIGIPLLILLAVILIRFRRNGIVQLMLLVAFAAWTVTLGKYLRVDTLYHPSIKLPYNYLRRIPLIDGAFDLRYSVIMYLGLSVVLAVGLDLFYREGLFHRGPPQPAESAPTDGRPFIARHGRAVRLGRRGRLVRAGLCLLVAVVALVPLVPKLPYTPTPAGVPAVFTASDSPIADGDVVLSFPLPVGYEGFNDQALLWQAVAKMRFKLIGFRGSVADKNHHSLRAAALLIPPLQAEQLLSWGLYGKPTPPPPADAATYAAIRMFLARYHVGDVSLVPSDGLHWQAVRSDFSAALRVAPVDFDGAYVWPHVQSDLGTGT